MFMLRRCDELGDPFIGAARIRFSRGYSDRK